MTHLNRNTKIVIPLCHVTLRVVRCFSCKSSVNTSWMLLSPTFQKP